VKTPKSPISKAMVNSIDAGEILERDTSSIFQHCAGAACRSYLYEERCSGGLLVQARGLDCASGEPILRQNLGVFMGFEQAWLKLSLAPFLAPTKYR
jgi:hypothetical protein